MCHSSYFYLHSLLYVTVSLTCLFIGFAYGAYIPNYGFVGCYLYTNEMEQFTTFNQQHDVICPITMHSCVQSCMEGKWNYAGLMAGSKCYCGMKYNQTFAVDEGKCDTKCELGEASQSCVGERYMAIYNTDYDVKPLLIIPGNNANFLEEWGKSTGATFEDMIIGDVYISSLIDRWNSNTLYHVPEYVSQSSNGLGKSTIYFHGHMMRLITVSVRLLNRYGHRLWSIEFFTNDTNSSEVGEWMTKERILTNRWYNNIMKNSTIIKVREAEGEIKICNTNDKIRFSHGLRLNNTRVTVFSPHGDGQSEVFINHKYLNCTKNATHKSCNCTTESKPVTVVPRDCDKVNGVCRNYSLNITTTKNSSNLRKCELKNFKLDWGQTPDHVVTPDNVSYVCFSKSGQSEWVCSTTTTTTTTTTSSIPKTTDAPVAKHYCLADVVCNIITKGPNYGSQRMTALNTSKCKQHGDVQTYDQAVYVCCIELSQWNGASVKMEFWSDEGTSQDESKIIELNACTESQSCVYTRSLKINFTKEQTNSCNYTLYGAKHDALIMADRVAVYGFYHREERKVSKWEFLNDYPLEEIKNIMRPFLEKSKTSVKVPLRNLSSSIRKKKSVADHRTSSQGIGILGGFLLGMVFLVIFVSDIFVMKAHLKIMYRNVTRYFRHLKRMNKRIKAGD